MSILNSSKQQSAAFFRPKLSQINILLFLAIVVVNGATIIHPLYPVAQFWWQRRFNDTTDKLQGYIDGAPSTNTKKNERSGQTVTGESPRLIIPRLMLEQKIYEGKSPSTVHKGIWRIPRSSNPAAGGNTVIAGHRFTYDGPAVFYHLDLVQPGDEIGVVWDHIMYLYTVSEIKTVTARQTDIEDPRGSNRLTMYTCTPLWSGKNRLVIVAKPVEAVPPDTKRSSP